jgi:hypothetical protein
VTGPAVARVTTCLGADEALAHEVEKALSGDTEALLVRPVIAADSTPEDWPSEASVAVLSRLRSVLEDGGEGAGRHCIVVVVKPDAGSSELAAATGATAEAMRGIVQSISVEVEPARLRVNVVISHERGIADLLRTLRHLSASSGGFFAGATVDVS